jgi:exopolyphosphatase/guanosine-5'-triphosphate,3'-diphosphate pyrophosphatase
LDLGSNTSLLLIADMNGDRLERVLHDETTITRMGQGVHANRAFHPEALERLDRCFASYARTIESMNCERVVAVATSAARDVSNGDQLIELGRKHGIPIHIISGEREARLTFKGALWDRPSIEGVAVVDVGGGSTEVITERNGRLAGISVDVGSVRLTELFQEDLPRLRDYARKAFAAADLPERTIREVVAVAGTPTTLAALDQRQDFSVERIQGYKISAENLENWIARLSAMSLEEREALPGMQPKRADVIVAGATILAVALKELDQSVLTVSTYGVRYGVALSWQEF